MESVNQLTEEHGVIPKLMSLGKYKGDIVAEAVSNNLILQLQYNKSLYRRIMREEKTMERCMSYILANARSYAERRSRENSSTIKSGTNEKHISSTYIGVNIDDGMVYMWATQYFLLDGLDVDADEDFTKPVKPYKATVPQKPVKPADTQLSIFDTADKKDVLEAV